MPKKYDREASSALSLTGSATENLYDVVDAISQELVLVSDAVLNQKITTVSHQLLFYDAIQKNAIINIGDNDWRIGYDPNPPHASYNARIILFSGDLPPEVGGTRHLQAYSDLTLVQTYKNVLKYGEGESLLTFEHIVSAAQPYSRSLYHNLTYPANEVDPVELNNVDLEDPNALAELFEGIGLRAEVSLNTVLSFGIESLLSFAQSTAPAYDLFLSHHVHLGHTTRPVLYEEVSDRLYFDSSSSGDTATPLAHELEITQSVEADPVFVINITSSLDLDQAVSDIIVDLCIDPTIIRRSSTILTYPYTSPTDELELRNPDFDNTEQFEFRRILRKSRGGTLQVYRDPNWPQAERLIMTFSALTQIDIKSLLDFMNKSLGKEIGLLDFESRQWRGIILTPASQTSEPSSAGFSASFEFEGSIV